MFLSDKKYYLGNFFINVYNQQDLLEKIKEAVLSKKKTTFGYLHAASYFYHKSKIFREALTSFNYIYLNSFYIGGMLKLIHKKEVKKINAEDFFYDTCSLADKSGWKIMLLGSDKNTNNKAIEKLQKKYKKANLFSHKGYFKNDREVVDFINEKAPNIIFCGLGTGYQEKWIYKNLKKIENSCVVINIGNFIDVLGGKIFLPPPLIKKLELEWFYRLIKEPKRLFGRYVYGGSTAASFFIKQIRPKKNKPTQFY